jgi:methionyl-tRNA formyltransferase
MNISILCTDPNHPVVDHLRTWKEGISKKGHNAKLVFDKADLVGGDILFLVSCSQMIRIHDREKFKATLVMHAGDLPKGRGWSPHIWSILDGADQLTVSLLEAAEPVDSGDIWLKINFDIEKHELLPEINAKLFAAELSLMTQAVENFGSIKPNKQDGDPGEYNRKRTPDDSRINPFKSIAEQFNLFRVSDYQRYPTFFECEGVKYLIKIEKA